MGNFSSDIYDISQMFYHSPQTFLQHFASCSRAKTLFVYCGPGSSLINSRILQNMSLADQKDFMVT